MNPQLVQEIERLKVLLQGLGLPVGDCLRPGLSERQIAQKVNQLCPQLAEVGLHEDFVTWFGWQNGINPDKYAELGVPAWGTFTPDNIRFDSLESVLETLNIYLEVDENAHCDNFLLFSNTGGSMYGICPTEKGWRMHYWDRDEGGPVTLPNIVPETSPTLTEWLKALNDQIEVENIRLDDKGLLHSVSRQGSSANCYPWK